MWPLQHAGDDADRWINNVLFPRSYHEAPKARYVRRKLVSLRALRIRTLEDLVEWEQINEPASP